MKIDRTAQGFIQLLNARIGQCASMDPQDKAVPCRRDLDQKVWIIRRGSEDTLFKDDPKALEPIRLIRGGQIELYLRIRELPKRAMEVAAYRMAFVGLPDNPNRIASLRFDRGGGLARGRGWDEDLKDNPEHPWTHAHINFHASEDANKLRLPTGEICPILLLRAFDFWYYITFLS